ncbi:macro domain-containing protein [Actinacidiphila glaucinigra]|uniref:macro domain-containing protein n=1 Tax=Actinacidiphila glaucinigra TaxID=235986 RepID=UPI0033F6DDAC
MRWRRPAFGLGPRVRHVIHAVGPEWEGGDQEEAEVLASCSRRCLEVADELGAASVAFPAIAMGVVARRHGLRAGLPGRPRHPGREPVPRADLVGRPQPEAVLVPAGPPLVVGLEPGGVQTDGGRDQFGQAGDDDIRVRFSNGRPPSSEKSGVCAQRALLISVTCRSSIRSSPWKRASSPSPSRN